MFGKIKNGFNRMVWKYLPSCKDITALISRSMEKDLSLREKLVMKTHLYTCIACRRYLTQLEFMSEVLGKQEEKIEREELEEAEHESFPASDPPGFAGGKKPDPLASPD